MYKNMSRLTKTPPTNLLETDFFEGEEAAEEYTPQHPVLALHSQLTSMASVANEDHITNYVEVDPFASKEK
jgi:hypothetical protein